jgi:hypothetical protein
MHQKEAPIGKLAVVRDIELPAVDRNSDNALKVLVAEHNKREAAVQVLLLLDPQRIPRQ